MGFFPRLKPLGRGRLVLGAVLAVLPAVLPAAQDRLTPLLEGFLRRDPLAAAAAADRTAARAQTREGAWAAVLPAVTAGASGSGTPGFWERGALSVSVGVSGPLTGGEIWGRTEAAGLVADRRLALELSDRAAAFLGTLIDLVEARARADLEVQRAGALADLAAAAEARLAAGAGGLSAALAARQQLSVARADLAGAQARRDRCEREAGVLAGVPVPGDLGFQDLWLAVPAFESGPRTRMREAEEALAEAQFRWATAFSGLAWSLSAASAVSPGSPAGPAAPTLNLGLSLSLPLVNDRVSSAPAAREAARARSLARREAEQRSFQELLRTDAGSAVRLDLYRQALADAQAYLAAVEASQAAGSSSFGDVLEARGTVYSRSLVLVGAEAEAVRAHVAVLAAAGLEVPRGAGP